MRVTHTPFAKPGRKLSGVLLLLLWLVHSIHSIHIHVYMGTGHHAGKHTRRNCFGGGPR